MEWDQFGVKPRTRTSNPSHRPLAHAVLDMSESGEEAVLRVRGQEPDTSQGQRSGGWRLLSGVNGKTWEGSSGSEGRGCGD